MWTNEGKKALKTNTAMELAQMTLEQSWLEGCGTVSHRSPAWGLRERRFLLYLRARKSRASEKQQRFDLLSCSPCTKLVSLLPPSQNSAGMSSLHRQSPGGHVCICYLHIPLRSSCINLHFTLGFIFIILFNSFSSARGKS